MTLSVIPNYYHSLCVNEINIFTAANTKLADLLKAQLIHYA